MDDLIYLEEIKKEIGEKKNISVNISIQLPEVYQIIDLLNSHTDKSYVKPVSIKCQELT